jgi:hypothetical protein
MSISLNKKYDPAPGWMSMLFFPIHPSPAR